MKCPKCGYIGFESAEKCRNCGYDFSLLSEPVRDVDLPLKGDEQLGAPADFEFRTGDTPAAIPEERRSAGAADFDLSPRTPRAVERDLPLFAPSPSETAAPAAPAAAATVPASGAAQVVAPRRRAARPQPATPLDFGENDLALEPETVLSRIPLARSATVAAGRPAGSIARAIAGLLDAAILIGLDAGVVYFTLRICRLSFADATLLPIAPLVAFFLLLDGGYLVAFTAVGGQTIGKMATSLKVVSEDGGHVASGQALVRTVGYFVSVLPAGLGFVPGFFGPSRRALHDHLANTRVVRLQ